MEMCRVCLSTETGMFPIDENFVVQYNLLTNLNITLMDGMPQLTCKTCLDTVKYYIKFREKSIASEETLRESISSILKLEIQVTALKGQKSFENDTGINNSIKNEIKEETEIDSDVRIDDYYISLEEYADDKQNLVKDEDVKPRQVEKQEKYKEEKGKRISKVLQKSFATRSSNAICDIKPKEVRKRRTGCNNKVVKKRKIGGEEKVVKKRKIGGEDKVVKKQKTDDDDDKVVPKINYDDRGSWICGICPKTLEEELDLNKHLDVHKDDRQCQLCNEKLNSLSQLLAHRLKHVCSKQLKCHICNKRYRSSLYLEHHYRNVHIEHDEPKLTCRICFSSFNTPKRLKNHISSVHSSLRFFCDFCSKGFSNKTYLKSHIKHHIGKKCYVCDLCGFSCNYNSGLRDHKVRKHSHMKINCKNCTRAFASEQDYERHTCKKQLKVCNVCGLQVIGANRLSNHMSTHNNVHKYQCERCPAKYKSKASLKVHYDRHDGNRTQQCEFCEEKFYTATVLIKHRRTHTGEKPYVCKVCNKGFTGGYNLKVHMRVHGEYLIVKKNSETDVTKS